MHILSTAGSDLQSKKRSAQKKSLQCLMSICFVIISSCLAYSQTFQFQFGTTSTAQGITIDVSGDLWVSCGDNVTRKFDASGNYLGQFGSGGAGPGLFNFPIGLSIDTANNLFVAEFNGNRIQKFDPTGAFLLQFGSTGSGPGQFSGAHGIAISPSNLLYVAEYYNNRIQVFDLMGNYLFQFGSTGTGPGQFQGATYLDFDPVGNLYVTDAINSRVQKFDASGNFLAQFGGPGTGNGQFARPSGIAIDQAGSILVGDVSANRFQLFDPSHSYVSQVGSTGSATSQFVSLHGMAADNLGLVYVSDYGNRRVQVFSYGTPLPSFNYSFSAVRESQGVRLILTADEGRPNGHFELLRSYDGRQWEALGEISESETNSYTFLDSDVDDRLAFYRLYEVDGLGKIQIGQVIVEPVLKEDFIHIWPNPTASGIAYVITGRPGGIVSLYNQEGKLLITNRLFSSKHELSLAGMEPGIYIVAYRNGESFFTQKIIVNP